MVDYSQRRKGERRLISHKNREQERREREEIEMYTSWNDAENFFKNIKRLTKGLKPEASPCRDERVNLVKDTQGVLRLWSPPCRVV